ncbi:MAG: MBOAT family O-acyltransferase [Verrucomicrobiota bacterium]
MLFNSYTFLLLFLPLTLGGWLLLRGATHRSRVCWLAMMSLVYYAWWTPDPSIPWKPTYLFLILGSCVGNFFFGRYLAGHHGPRGKRMLTLGVVANLAVLGWFKYAGFFDKVFLSITGGGLDLPNVILPLGISFFTFQQIAYLVDAFRGETKEYHFTDYLLFVTFFPQLIAGPIVHHKEMMPQFSRGEGTGWHRHLPIAFGFLVIGLFKKVVIADHCAAIATPLFDGAAMGERPLTMAEAWTATVGYTMQIYFDFSGYSDMAIGAARFFGIRLPLNFHSPYKATSIVDFWRRWHMTLSRFLRDYLYIPLGGNRKGPARRYLNLLTTMLLGGLWHGAGWTYLMWGGLHGLYLCANHAWHWMQKQWQLPTLPKPVAIGLTFFFAMLAWVPFRAGQYELARNGSASDALRATGSIFASMFGLNGFNGWPDKTDRLVASSEPLKLVPVLIACWLIPNTQQIFRRYRPALTDLPRFPNHRWQWRPTIPFALATVVLMIIIGLSFDKVSEFIYFQF